MKMTTNNLPAPGEPKKDALEIRLNSVLDAKAAVQNFIPIQREAKKRGYGKITFIIERTLSAQIHAVLGTFFREVKTAYVWAQAPETREFYPLPHYQPTSTAVAVEPNDSVPFALPSIGEDSAPPPRRRPGRPPKTAAV